MSRADERKFLLTGKEIEEWFHEFAETTKVLSKRSYSLSKIVNLLNNELPIRFDKARDMLYREYRDGNEWIDSIQIAKIEPNIHAQQKTEFGLHLLDLVASIDEITEFKRQDETVIRVAVDVTSNVSDPYFS